MWKVVLFDRHVVLDDRDTVADGEGADDTHSNRYVPTVACQTTLRVPRRGLPVGSIAPMSRSCVDTWCTARTAHTRRVSAQHSGGEGLPPATHLCFSYELATQV